MGWVLGFEFRRQCLQGLGSGLAVLRVWLGVSRVWLGVSRVWDWV